MLGKWYESEFGVDCWWEDCEAFRRTYNRPGETVCARLQTNGIERDQYIYNYIIIELLHPPV